MAKLAKFSTTVTNQPKPIHFPRLVRLFSILGQLSPHSQVTVQSLAEEHGVSCRTITRDIDVLILGKMGVFYDENDVIKISRVGYARIRSWILG